MTLSDKEILSDLLLSQKLLVKEYGATASHTDDAALLRDLCQIEAEEQQLRLQIYEAMHQRGWYTPQPIDQAQIDRARATFQGVAARLTGGAAAQGPYTAPAYQQPFPAAQVPNPQSVHPS